jgi:hypothetical protein
MIKSLIDGSWRLAYTAGIVLLHPSPKFTRPKNFIILKTYKFLYFQFTYVLYRPPSPDSPQLYKRDRYYTAFVYIFVSEYGFGEKIPEPEFANVEGSQASISRNLFRQPMLPEPEFVNVEPGNRFQGIDSASPCSLAGRYVKWGCRTGPPGWESIPGLLKRFANTGSCRAGTTTLFLLGSQPP